MKRSRKEVRRKAVAVPELKFECQSLTSFSGLVIWQKFFAVIGLKRRLDQCLRHLSGGKIYTPATIFLQLIVHVLLGFRELRAFIRGNDQVVLHCSKALRYCLAQGMLTHF